MLMTPCSLSLIVYTTRVTPADLSLREQVGQGRAIPSEPSWRMRETQTMEFGVSFWERRTSACTCEQRSGAGPFEDETRVPSLRKPTAPRRKDRLSSLRRAIPAAKSSISSSDRPFILCDYLFSFTVSMVVKSNVGSIVMVRAVVKGTWVSKMTAPNAAVAIISEAQNRVPMNKLSRVIVSLGKKRYEMAKTAK
jgi:hypothetical protein